MTGQEALDRTRLDREAPDRAGARGSRVASGFLMFLELAAAEEGTLEGGGSAAASGFLRFLGVAVVVEESQQSFAKRYEEEEGCEGEEKQHRGTNRSVWVRLPSLPPI